MKKTKFLAGLLAGLSVVLGSWCLAACDFTASSPDESSVESSTQSSIESSSESASESSSASSIEEVQPQGVIYQVIDGEAVVTGYNGDETSIVIEATYEGVAVTKIAKNAFDSNATLTEIVIPDSVTEIGGSAFTMCLGLTTVTLGSGLEKIGESAFAYCSNLSTINFNGTIKQWKAVNKTSDWTLVLATKVVCSNGEADLLAK